MSYGLPTKVLYSRFISDESGAMLAEYALLLALFGMGCACALYYFSHAISKALADAANLIASLS